MCPVTPLTSLAASDAAMESVMPKLETLHKAIAKAHASPSPLHASEMPARLPIARSLSGERFTYRGNGVVAFENEEIQRETASRIAELRCTAAQMENGSVNATLAMKALKYRKLLQRQQQLPAVRYTRSC